MIIEKKCPRCETVKPASAFRANPRMRSGLTSYCKDCARDYMRERNYGVSASDLKAIFEDQGSVCAVCFSQTPGGRGEWHVDHCHETGQIRGLLCANCNIGIGYLANDAERMHSAASYMGRSQLAA